jgi:hypothetical protein
VHIRQLWIWIFSFQGISKHYPWCQFIYPNFCSLPIAIYAIAIAIAMALLRGVPGFLVLSRD